MIFLCTLDLSDEPTEVEAREEDEAAETLACETDEDGADGAACDVYVREPDAREWTVFRVTTRVTVDYNSRRVRTVPVTDTNTTEEGDDDAV
jgi:hypothetical protein